MSEAGSAVAEQIAQAFHPWSAALSVDITTTVAESVDTVARAIEEIWE